MDVVALAQHGIEYAVATLGTSTTPVHAQKLFRLADLVVFCFDGDSAGRKAAWRALENTLPVLTDGKEARFLFLPDGEDPDDFVRGHGKAAFERAIDGATPLSEYLLAELAAQHPPAHGRRSRGAGRRRAALREPDHCTGLARAGPSGRSLNSPDLPDGPTADAARDPRPPTEPVRRRAARSVPRRADPPGDRRRCCARCCRACCSNRRSRGATHCRGPTSVGPEPRALGGAVSTTASARRRIRRRRASSSTSPRPSMRRVLAEILGVGRGPGACARAGRDAGARRCRPVAARRRPARAAVPAAPAARGSDGRRARRADARARSQPPAAAPRRRCAVVNGAVVTQRRMAGTKRRRHAII